MSIANCRDLFDLPDDVAYLNCAYMSPLPRDAVNAGIAGVSRKAHPWEVTPQSFFDGSERLRGLFARLISAAPDDVAIVPSASYGLSTAAANVELRAGDQILVLAEQFPSNYYPWKFRADETGAELCTVAKPNDDDWTSALLALISTRTAVISIPAVHWAYGTVIDLVAVRRAADEVGAALVLDLSQSLGAMPFDIAEVRPDFMVCPVYKWLLGPYSMGFLYAAPHRQNGRPIEQNWITRAGSEDFARLVEYRDDYQAGARRYDMGERANFALAPMVEVALERLLAWGVEEIYQSLSARNREIIARAAGLGFTAPAEHLRAGHYLGMRHPEGLDDDIVPKLASHGVYVSRRGDCLRVTPHLYNTDQDVDRLFGALESL
jgi:selenocysteine lyase/cysteine desulfurase